jgi:putative tryptophan/tyrosine transport system substrate-binding protein
MKRREFITLIGGTAVVWPLAVVAQQGQGPVRVGVLPLGSASNPYNQALLAAFRRGLREVGLLEVITSCSTSYGSRANSSFPRRSVR